MKVHVVQFETVYILPGQLLPLTALRWTI